MMRCRSCDAEIRWITMVDGSKHPVNIPHRTVFVIENGLGMTRKGYTSHFATCPKADKNRQKATIVQDDLFSS